MAFENFRGKYSLKNASVELFDKIRRDLLATVGKKIVYQSGGDEAHMLSANQLMEMVHQGMKLTQWTDSPHESDKEMQELRCLLILLDHMDLYRTIATSQTLPTEKPAEWVLLNESFDYLCDKSMALQLLLMKELSKDIAKAGVDFVKKFRDVYSKAMDSCIDKHKVLLADPTESLRSVVMTFSMDSDKKGVTNLKKIRDEVGDLRETVAALLEKLGKSHVQQETNIQHDIISLIFNNSISLHPDKPSHDLWSKYIMRMLTGPEKDLLKPIDDVLKAADRASVQWGISQILNRLNL